MVKAVTKTKSRWGEDEEMMMESMSMGQQLSNRMIDHRIDMNGNRHDLVLLSS